MVRVREESEKRESSVKSEDGSVAAGATGTVPAAVSSTSKENNNNVKKKDKREGGESEVQNGSPDEAPAPRTSPEKQGEKDRGERERGKEEVGGRATRRGDDEQPRGSRSYYSSHKKYLPHKSYQSSSWNHHHHHPPHHSYDYGGGYDSGGDQGWGASGVGAGPYGSSYSYPAAAAFYDLSGANGVGGGYYNSSPGYYGGGSYGHQKRRGGGPRHGRGYHSR
jgi:hypothetical protein